MENPCKIVFFGDSIIKSTASYFSSRLKTFDPDLDFTVINEAISGETSRDGLRRLTIVADHNPDVVVICFGTNDWKKGIEKEEYKRNLQTMLAELEKIGARVIFTTLTPGYDPTGLGTKGEVDCMNEIVRSLAREKRIKIADINEAWNRKLPYPRIGLRDGVHPNRLGRSIIVETLLGIVTRRSTTILWQYNGREAKCNFRCPYCYYLGLHNPSDKSFGSIEQWHASLKDSFGSQHLYLYLGFGEPTLGKMFPQIVEMVDSEKNWQLRIISNLATKKAKTAATSRLAKDGRLHVVGSFHPSMMTKEKYLQRLNYFRDCGIEVPTVYVAYPPYLNRLDDDITYFREYGHLVHLRRMQGLYNGQMYPDAYSEPERRQIAKYMDDGMLKYMQSGISSYGDLSYSGLHFFIMDNVGNLGYDSNHFHEYTKSRCIFGNVHQGNFKPNLLPEPYPGTREGTVDGIANIIKYAYRELEGNHVLSFAKQGNVERIDDNTIDYGNEHRDFADPKIRAEYNFPPSTLGDIRYAKEHAKNLSARYFKRDLSNLLGPIRRRMRRR